MTRKDGQQRVRMDPTERRDRILAAAVNAFAAAPYEQVSMAAIAEQVGASEALVYRYFPGKAELYAEVVQVALDDLGAKIRGAQAELPPGVSARDRMRATTIVYLDHIAHHPDAWAAPLALTNPEPRIAASLREAARKEYVERLRRLLVPGDSVRSEYALWGFFGFLDAACLRWVQRRCPEDDRWSLIDAVLGALEGALGDWGR